MTCGSHMSSSLVLFHSPWMELEVARRATVQPPRRARPPALPSSLGGPMQGGAINAIPSRSCRRNETRARQTRTGRNQEALDRLLLTQYKALRGTPICIILCKMWGTPLYHPFSAYSCKYHNR
jgi:hypothetical protein